MDKKISGCGLSQHRILGMPEFTVFYNIFHDVLVLYCLLWSVDEKIVFLRLLDIEGWAGNDGGLERVHLLGVRDLSQENW